MRALIILILPLILVGCSAKNQSTTRDIAISLIERSYPVDGRRLEYSQIDSVDSELRGYFLGRIYIDSDDSIRAEKFHLNYAKTKVDIVDSFTIAPAVYKALLFNDKIFTDNFLEDFKRIYRRLCSADTCTYQQDSIDQVLILQADSILALD